MHYEYCLRHIAKMKGFAGTIVPGKSLDIGDGASVFPAASQPPPANSNDEDASASMGSEAEELQRDAEDDEEDEQVHHDLLDVLQISLDGVRLRD